MKIVMHCVYFPPEVGGLESHVFYLCRALAARGHDVHVVTSRSRPDLRAREVMDGVHVWRSWLPSRTPVGWTVHALASVPRTRRLAVGADILHAQAFSSVLPCALAARGAPVVVTYHTSHFLKRARRRRWRPVLRRLVRAADRSLAASREIARVAEGLAPGTKVEPLTNGVDTTFFRPVEPTLERPDDGADEDGGEGGTLRIVVPRRLFRKNGVEFMVRALPQILEHLPGTEAVVIGDGPERSTLEALARDLGVDHALRFLGARPHREMPGLLCSGDLAIFPSLMEATSVAALECMACGVPVLASRVGGLPEIVDDDVGGLFEPADPESLAGAVVRTVRERELTALGRTARERVVSRWSNEMLTERHLDVYEELIAEARRGRGRTSGTAAEGGNA